MLTKATVLDPTGLVPPLQLPLIPEQRLVTDIIQCTNIDGLGPVKATVSTASLGSIDGASYLGSNVDDRNIIISLLPKPDWVDWDIPKIRNEIYKYFMPRSYVHIVFESTDRDGSPVGIYGYVESCEPNIFSKDNEMQASIICPKPHFISEAVIVRTGITSDPDIDIDYIGTIDNGIVVNVIRDSADVTADFSVFVNGYSFQFHGSVDINHHLVMNSKSGEKSVKNVNPYTGEEFSILNRVALGSIWPKFHKGANTFRLESSAGVAGWQLQYFEKFGGL